MKKFVVVAQGLDQPRAIGVAVDAEERLALLPGAVGDVGQNTVVAGKNGALDGRSTSPAGQQGRVDVDAAETRHVEDCLGQDQPVGGDNHHIGTDGAHALLGSHVLQGQWLEYRNAMLLGKALDR